MWCALACSFASRLAMRCCLLPALRARRLSRRLLCGGWMVSWGASSAACAVALGVVVGRGCVHWPLVQMASVVKSDVTIFGLKMWGWLWGVEKMYTTRCGVWLPWLKRGAAWRVCVHHAARGRVILAGYSTRYCGTRPEVDKSISGLKCCGSGRLSPSLRHCVTRRTSDAGPG